MTITTVHRPLLNWSLSVRQSGRGFVLSCQSRQCGRGFVLGCQSRQYGRGIVLGCQSRHSGRGIVLGCQSRQCGRGIELVCQRTATCKLGRGLAPTRSQGAIYYGVLAQWDVRSERLERVESQKVGELSLHHLQSAGIGRVGGQVRYFVRVL